MGRSIRYIRLVDKGFYRCLIEINENKASVLTYFEDSQNQFFFENVKEFETEFANEFEDVISQELWLCRVDHDGGDFYNRLSIKIPHSLRGSGNNE